MNTRKITASILSLLILCSVVSCKKDDSETIELGDTEEITTAASSDVVTDIPETEETVMTFPEVLGTPDNLTFSEADTTAPLILSVSNNVTLYPGDTFDINDYISYIDDYDNNPTLTVDGEVNVNRYGVYPLTATITDASGNTNSATINVTMAPVPPTTSPDQTTEPTEFVPYQFAFEDFRNEYRDEANGVLVGIDVSKWQGEIDFEAVKAAGCDFVMMRIAVFTNEFNIDPYYLQNIRAAKAAGLMVGVYYYSADTNAEQLRAHVGYLMDILDGEELDFPIAFDWESWTKCQQYHVSINELRYLLDVFDEEVQSYGYDSMLYGSKYYLEAIWNNGNGHTSWVAHYNSSTDYQGDYIMWQTSCIGSIPGIDTDVDLDVYYSGN